MAVAGVIIVVGVIAAGFLVRVPTTSVVNVPVVVVTTSERTFQSTYTEPNGIVSWSVTTSGTYTYTSTLGTSYWTVTGTYTTTTAVAVTSTSTSASTKTCSAPLWYWLFGGPSSCA
jgi:hypothetical protein